MKTRIIALYSWFEKLLNPYPESPITQPPTGLFSFLWFCTRGMRGMLLVMSLATTAIGIFDAVLFSMLGSVIDWLVATQPGQLWQAHYGKLLMLGTVLFLSPLLIILQSMLKDSGISSNFPMRLRWNFHRYLLEQSLNFYQNEFAGRITTKVMQTALAVRETIFLVLDMLVFASVNVISLIVVISLFDIRLIWPFLGWALLYGVVMKLFIPALGKVARDQADARSLMTGRVTDAYTNISTVKLFSHSQREASFVRGAMQEFLTTAYWQERLASGFEIVNHILTMLFIASTATLALWLWSLGEVSVGAVATAIAMSLRILTMSHWIMWQVAILFENIGTLQDGIGTLARPLQIVDVPDARPLTVRQGEIRFEAVDFAYNQDLPVISQFTLTLQPGERVGLVGRSGAGKSTIVNLLLRFYNLQSGRITIDGTDIAKVTQESLRSQIGMVTQDTSLLHRSVRDNLTYGRPDSSEEEMICAAKQAHVDEFIHSLHDGKGHQGYDAHVGERGVKLSGGQRQRIAIARVILKNAPILILDEATSALDSEVEGVIQENLYQLMQGKTVLAIAHRLSTIAAMDRLIVIDKGQIVEQGTHSELLEQKGLYARLWQHQSGGFLGGNDNESI